MKPQNTPDIIRFETPESEHPLIFRDLLAIELRGYHNIKIDNVDGSDVIEIKGATEKEAKRIRTRIKDLGVSVIEK